MEIHISIPHRLRSTKNPERSALFPIHLAGSIKRRATLTCCPTMSLLSKYSINFPFPFGSDGPAFQLANGQLLSCVTYRVGPAVTEPCN
jgi:hypothetical protein